MQPTAQEAWLLKLLFLQEETLAPASAQLDPVWIHHALVRGIVVRRLAAHRENTWGSLAAFLDECEIPEMQGLITQAIADERPLPNPVQQLLDVLGRLRQQWIDRQLPALIRQANQPETPEAERIELLRRHQELLRQKRQPLAPAPGRAAPPASTETI